MYSLRREKDYKCTTVKRMGIGAKERARYGQPKLKTRSSRLRQPNRRHYSNEIDPRGRSYLKEKLNGQRDVTIQLNAGPREKGQRGQMVPRLISNECCRN